VRWIARLNNEYKVDTSSRSNTVPRGQRVCPHHLLDAANPTLDGVGNGDALATVYGKGNKIDVSHEMHFPHSLASALISALT